jgi:hypothetical protein
MDTLSSSGAAWSNTQTGQEGLSEIYYTPFHVVNSKIFQITTQIGAPIFRKKDKKQARPGQSGQTSGQTLRFP